MYDLIGGCRTPGSDWGPRHSLSAALMGIFMTKEKSTQDIVQPVIMPFSNLCHADEAILDVTLILKSL